MYKILKIKSLLSHMGQGGGDLRFYSPQPDTGLHCEAMDSGLSTFIIHRVPDNYQPTHGWMARLS